MTERERLIELFKNFSFKCIEPCGKQIKRYGNKITIQCEKCKNEQIADYLLENGVIAPPVKVGDTVHAKKGCFYLLHATRIKADDIITCEIIAIKETKKGKFLLLKPLIEEAFNMRSANDWFSFLAIGKTVFLTREEAEQALRGEKE